MTFSRLSTTNLSCLLTLVRHRDIGSSAPVVEPSVLCLSAHPGLPVETILSPDTGNPVVFVDELDNGLPVQTTRGPVTSAWTAVLELLEPGTATRWSCPHDRMPFDMGHVCRLLASNRLGPIPAPFQSRARGPAARAQRGRPRCARAGGGGERQA